MEVLNKSLIFDTETTGLPARGAKWDVDFQTFPRIVQLAWVFGKKERSYIIKPQGWTIEPGALETHGITQERAESEGVPFKDVIGEFIEDCKKAKYIVGHNVYFDTSIVKAMILFVMGKEYFVTSGSDEALDKGKRVDTMMKTIRFVNARYKDGRPGKYPRLEELYDKLFPGEKFPAHDALEDVKAVVRCLPPLIEKGIIVMGQKIAPKDPEDPKPRKTKTAKRIIDFRDPDPVTKPVGVQEQPTPEKVVKNKRNLLSETDF